MSRLESEFKKQSIDDIITEAIEIHGREEFWCLLSGGKDSMASTWYISKHYPKYFKGCYYAMTGSGIKESRYHVIEQCKKYDWPLTFTWCRMPSETQTGERWIDICLKSGFGGRGNHKIWMAFTKHHGWRNMINERMDYNPCFISGVRKKESRKRDKISMYTRKPIDWDGKLCFVKPLFYQTGTTIWDIIIENDLKISPVHDILNISGDSICGCNAQMWELELIKQMANEGLNKGIKNGYYYAYDNIKWTERMIEKKITWLRENIPNAQGEELADLQKQYFYLTTYNTWSHGPTTEEQDQQTTMADFIEETVCGESCEVNN